METYINSRDKTYLQIDIRYDEGLFWVHVGGIGKGDTNIKGYPLALLRKFRAEFAERVKINPQIKRTDENSSL